MGHKRKRESEVPAKSNEDIAEPAPKREKVKDAAAAERRQKRSERKSKKAQQAQGDALQKQAAFSGPELVKASPAAPIDPLSADFIPLGDIPDATAPQDKAKRVKKEKKRKATEVSGDTTDAQTRASKSSGTKQHSPHSLRKGTNADNAQSAITEEHGSDMETATGKLNANPNQKPRFICFVGNLPYTCTTDQLQSHFRKLVPSQIRHATDKQTGKSKGFAFLEFDQYDKMKTCLKVYHHSVFDPERTAKLGDEAFGDDGAEITRGQQGKSKGRKINVELTVGGGGGGENRKEKIKGKNQRLGEQRARRKAAEEQAQGKKHGGVKSGVNATPVAEVNGDIHPSRLKRVRH